MWGAPFYSALHASPFGSPTSGAQRRKRIVFPPFLFGQAKRKGVAQQGEIKAISIREEVCFVGPSGNVFAVNSVPRDRTLSLEDALIATAVAQRKADAEAEIQKLTMQLSELRAKIRIEEERHHNVVTEHRASDGATSQVSTRSSSMDPSAPDEGSVTPIESGATSTDGSGAASVEMKEISSNPQPSVDDLPDDEASDEIGDVELEVEKEKDERPQRECSSEEAPLIGAHGRAMYSMERKKAYWWSFGLKLVRAVTEQQMCHWLG